MECHVKANSDKCNCTTSRAVVRASVANVFFITGATGSFRHVFSLRMWKEAITALCAGSLKFTVNETGQFKEFCAPSLPWPVG